MTNKRRKFQKIKEEKPEQAEGLPDLDRLIKEIKAKYGIELEPKRNSAAAIFRLIAFLKSRFEFRYNKITLDVEYRRINTEKYYLFQDWDRNCVVSDARTNNFQYSKQFMCELIFSDKISEPYNPFEEYIFGLKEWNKEEDLDYIGLYLNQITLSDESERPLFVEYFKRWFTAMVASLVTDHVVNHECFVLVGKQGIFKTTFLNALVPKKLRNDYLFASKYMFDDKDHYKFLATKMLINLDELATFSKTDEGLLNTILTNDMVVVRLPYAATDSKWTRRASFCGSTNNREFLKDETGNRRFLVFEVDNIVPDKEVNIDDIYAQALALYKDGLKFWFDEEDINNIRTRNNRFHDVSIEQDLIQVYLIKPTDEQVRAGNCMFRTPTDINTYLAGLSNRITVNESTKRRINQVLRKLGFMETQKRLNGSSVPTRVWAVKFVDKPEVGNEPEDDGCPF